MPPEAPFYWKLRIGILAKDIRKDGPAPPTPPVFRVVLYHTEASGQRLLRRSVSTVGEMLECKNLEFGNKNQPVIDFRRRIYFTIYTRLTS